MKIKIDKGIRIDDNNITPIDKLYFPFKDMVVNDSFFIPIDISLVNVTNLGNKIRYHAEKQHCKVTIKQDGNGIRVWKVADLKKSSNFNPVTTKVEVIITQFDENTEFINRRIVNN